MIMLKFRSQIICIAWTVSFVYTSSMLGQVVDGTQHKEALATLSGTVIDDDGPLSGQEISILRLGAERGHPILLNSCIAKTDLDGYFRCERLLAGDYFIAVKTKVASAAIGATKLPAFSLYGGFGDLERAMPVTLQPSDVQSMTFSVLNADVYKIQGTVPENVENAEVSLSAITSSGLEYPIVSQAASELDGSFLFERIPRGQYLMKADWKDKQKNEVNVVYPVAISDRDITGIGLKASSIDIRVSVEDSESSHTGHGTSFLHLENVNTGFEAKSVYDESKLEYLFSQVPVGDYLFTVETRTHGCIDTISRAGHELTNPFRVDAGQLDLNLVVTARAQCGTIQGMLAPATKGQIVLTSDRMEVLYTLDADANGNFTISGLVPGRYRLFAWASTKNVPFRNPEMLRNLSDSSLSIDVPNIGTAGSAVIPQIPGP